MPTATGQPGSATPRPPSIAPRSVTPLIQQALSGGMPPAEVADLVADAITAGRFWVLPHPEFVELAARRWRRIADGEDPELEVDVPGLPPAAEIIGKIKALLAMPSAQSTSARNSGSSRRLARSSSSRAQPATSGRIPIAVSELGERAVAPPLDRLEAGEVVLQRRRAGMQLEPLSEDLARPRRIASYQRGGAERPLPRRGLERRRTAEAEHRRPRLRRHRVPVRRRIGDEHVSPRRRVVGVAVDRECRPAGRDEVQLLVGEVRILGVRLDDVLARLAGGVGVAAERAHPERHPDRMPGQAPGAGNRLELVEVDDLRRARATRGFSLTG